MSEAVPGLDTRTGLVHEALPYRDDADYASCVRAFVQAGVAADAPVLVEVPGPRLGFLREALGGLATEVEFADMRADGHNPGRIIPAVLRRFVDRHPQRRVWMLTEPLWPGRTPREYTAAVQHEALVNLAFKGHEATILCAYDVAHLPDQVLVDVERTHPGLLQHGERRPSPGYVEPLAVVDALYHQQPDPPADAQVDRFTVVADARRIVTQWAERAGLPAEQVIDLEIAISEIGGNSIVHAGHEATLLRWTEDDSLVCEIRDPGHIIDPLAGKLPPPAHDESGRGLLLVNYLCDLVEINTGPAGTAIRLWMDLRRA